MFKDKIILITGGSGSWGQEITKQLLLRDPAGIIILSRGEDRQVRMQREFCDSRIKYVIGDVRDSRTVDEVMSWDIDYVFHAAALKHVPICENRPDEAIKTNIQGTQNLIDAAIRNNVKKFVTISTDKVVSPYNLYGMTKAIAEKLTIQANLISKGTQFICTRTGNVLGTNGSIIPYILDQIKSKNEINITDRRMVRFFLTLSEAVELLFLATEYGICGEIYVRDIPAFYLSDLFELLVEFYGNKETKINEIGIREGEKIDEELISASEIDRTYERDGYYIIRPQFKTHEIFRELPKTQIKHLTSGDKLETKDYLIKLLKKGGWL